jgi:hypothetical protein
VSALTHEEKKTLARCSCGHLIASHDGDEGAGCMAALEEEPWVECHCTNSERQAEVAGLNEFAELRIAAAGQQIRDAVLTVVPQDGSLVVLRMPDLETPEDIPWAHLRTEIPGTRFLIVDDDVEVATIPPDELQPALIKLLERSQTPPIETAGWAPGTAPLLDEVHAKQEPEQLPGDHPAEITSLQGRVIRRHQ